MALFVWLPRFHAWTQSEIYILKRLYCSPFRIATDEHHKPGWGEGKRERGRDRDVTLYFLINRCITNCSLNAVSHIGNFTQTSLISPFITRSSSFYQTGKCRHHKRSRAISFHWGFCEFPHKPWHQSIKVLLLLSKTSLALICPPSSISKKRLEASETIGTYGIAF